MSNTQNTVSNRQRDIMVALLDEPKTRAQLGNPAIPTMNKMVEAGILQVKETVKSGKRGRPASIFSLTANGKKRAQRAAAAIAAEAEAPAVEAEAPAVEAEAPAVEAEAPAVEAEAPAVEAAEEVAA